MQVLRLKPRALTAEERELIKDLKPIEEIVPRPTPEQQLAFLQKQGEPASNNDEEKVASTDDLPQ